MIINFFFTFVKQKTAAMLCVFFFMFAGCEHEETTPQDYFMEIPINSKRTVINSTVEGIGFKFCLLNEKGVPATKFKQGENFSFHFSMINRRKHKINTIDDLWCQLPSSFSQVISLNQDTIYCPFFIGICNATFDYQPFFGMNNEREITVHWDNKLRSHLPHLPAGEYYTVFTHEFILYHETTNHFFTIGPLTFKINFKIENNHEINLIF